LGAGVDNLTDLKTSIAKCAIIAGQLDRLQCYDDAASAAGIAGPQPEVPAEPSVGVGKWQINRDKNPIDDSERVVAALAADSGQSRFEGPVTLIARCQSKKTELYISWGEYLGNDGDIYSTYKKVTIRIGQRPATTQNWPVSTDSKATFAPDWAGSLLKAMAASDKFVAQVTPYNESPITAIFDTTGMQKALSPLASVCGWSFGRSIHPSAPSTGSQPKPMPLSSDMGF
jgi:type VI secretion system protein VasI